jgi:hypothetical protein
LARTPGGLHLDPDLVAFALAVHAIHLGVPVPLVETIVRAAGSAEEAVAATAAEVAATPEAYAAQRQRIEARREARKTGSSHCPAR